MPPLISISIKITTSSVTLETFVSKVLVPDWWVVGPKDWKYYRWR